jgi:hypothetical protein
MRMLKVRQFSALSVGKLIKITIKLHTDQIVKNRVLVYWVPTADGDS